MMNDALLGPAEKHVIEQVRELITSTTQTAEQLLQELLKIDTSNLEEVMLDTKHKEMVIALISPLGNLNKNLSVSLLIPILAQVALKGEDE
jgi:hypothetical protein